MVTKRSAAASDGRRRAWSTRLPVVLVALLLAAATTVTALDGREEAARQEAVRETPAVVPPPPGVDLPEPADPRPVAEPVAAAPSAPAVRRVVARFTRDKAFGPHLRVVVADPTGTVVADAGRGLVTPASTLKLLTATAALAALGPGHRFETEVRREPDGRLVLVGGGDPYLSARPDPTASPVPASLRDLARRTAQALSRQGSRRVRLGYDSSLFAGPTQSTSWPASYLADQVVAPIAALSVDGGRDPDGIGRSADPPKDAAVAFAAQLERAGVQVRGAPRAAVATADSTRVAAVQGAPLTEVAQRLLEISDNEAAEMVGRAVALAEGRTADFDGGAGAVLDVLGRLGVDLTGARTFDGSGLSRRNRLAPGTLVQLLALVLDDDRSRLRSAASGLPVSGYTGSLSIRFADADPLGLGVARLKTGTLTEGGVHGYAGTLVTRDGVPLIFVAIADRVKVAQSLGARDALDRLAAELAACRCGQ